MAFTPDSFAGFGPEDFAAFEPHKWSSNRFNLERMRTRSRLDGLGRMLAERLGDATGGLVFRTTVDHPHIFNGKQVKSLWLYLDRPEEERVALARMVDRELTLEQRVADSVPHHQVAIVAVGIDGNGVGTFFGLHAHATLDRRNLLARLAEPAEQSHLAVLLGRLPPGARAELDGEAVPLPARAEGVVELARRLEGSSGWLTIGRPFGRESAEPASPAFAADLAALLPPLLDLWRFAAWSRDNDRLKLVRVLKEERKHKVQRLTGLAEGDRVAVATGLLAGREGSVLSVDLKGRVRVQFGRLTMEMDPKLLRKC